MKKKKMIIIGIIALLSICIMILLAAFIKGHYSYVDSADGNWRAYMIHTERGSDMGVNGCDGILVYKGNSSGDTGTVDITVDIKGNHSSHDEHYDYVSHPFKRSNLLFNFCSFTLRERMLIWKSSFYYYWGGDVKGVDSIKLKMQWTTSKNVRKTTHIIIKVPK